MDTGHLVLSTLHTNSAPETVVRLIEMGKDPFNFADAFLGILAQRLARKLCDQCKEFYHPDKDSFEDLVQMYDQVFGPIWILLEGSVYYDHGLIVLTSRFKLSGLIQIG